jgi:N-acetylmuramoyl-L-alanine amidase
MRIAVDKGHRGYDSGAVGPTGLQEADITADIVDDSTLGVDNNVNVEDILRAAGHEVLVIQSSGAQSLNEDLAQRVNQANAWGADLYISVHVNCCDSSSPSYVSTWIYSEGGESEKLANCVQHQLVSATGAPDGGVRTANFYVLRKTNMPSILCECLFISNPGQEKQLRTEFMRDNCAIAIAKGVAEYLGDAQEGGNAVEWAKWYFEKLIELGILNGQHKSDEAITFGQVAVLLCRLLRFLGKI